MRKCTCCAAPTSPVPVATEGGDMDVVVCAKCDRRSCPHCGRVDLTGRASRCADCAGDMSLVGMPQ